MACTCSLSLCRLAPRPVARSVVFTAFVVGLVAAAQSDLWGRGRDAAVAALEDCQPEIRWSGAKPTAIYFHNIVANLNLDDQHLETLAELPSLEVVSIMFAPYVSDRGLSRLAEIKGLKTLVVEYAPLTDNGLNSFAGLKHLCALSVAGTRITDAGLAHLAALPELRSLNVTACMVSDKGLAALKQFPRIKRVIVGGDAPGLTEAGVERLRQQIPSVHVFDTFRDREIYQKSAPHGVQKSFSWYGRTPEGGVQVLLAERSRELCISQLLCNLTPAQLSQLNVKANEARRLRPALFELVRPSLPPELVNWFSEQRTQNTEPIHDEWKVYELLDEGLRIEFRVGASGGGAEVTDFVVKREKATKSGDDGRQGQ